MLRGIHNETITCREAHGWIGRGETSHRKFSFQHVILTHKDNISPDRVYAPEITKKQVRKVKFCTKKQVKGTFVYLSKNLLLFYALEVDDISQNIM